MRLCQGILLSLSLHCFSGHVFSHRIPSYRREGGGKCKKERGGGSFSRSWFPSRILDPTVVQANGEPTRKPPNSSGTDNLSQVYESRRFLRTLRGVLRETKRFSAFQITVPQFWTLEETKRMVDQRSMNPPTTSAIQRAISPSIRKLLNPVVPAEQAKSSKGIRTAFSVQPSRCLKPARVPSERLTNTTPPP